MVCDNCGHTAGTNIREFDKRGERRFITLAITIAVVFVAGFVQISRWDKYFARVSRIQIAELFGAASERDSRAMANICIERKIFSCAESRLESLTKSDFKVLLELGALQMRLGEFGAAARSYQLYFKAGGKGSEPGYRFAEALTKVGLLKEAIRYYEYAIKANPKVVMVSVTRDYVKVLIQANRLAQAEHLILQIRSRSQSANQFMDAELKSIRNRTVHLASRS